jgi:hypothetical protein
MRVDIIVEIILWKEYDTFFYHDKALEIVRMQSKIEFLKIKKINCSAEQGKVYAQY